MYHQTTGGAVQDAEDAADAVAGQSLPHGFHDGNAAGHRGLEIECRVVRVGEPCQRRAVGREQRLVRRHHRLPRRERRLHRRLRRIARPADQLDEYVYSVALRQRDRIVEPGEPRQIMPALLAPVARRHRGDNDLPPCPRPHQVRVPRQDIEHARAHRAEPGDP